jgi:hypothetical protein
VQIAFLLPSAVTRIVAQNNLACTLVQKHWKSPVVYGEHFNALVVEEVKEPGEPR